MQCPKCGSGVPDGRKQCHICFAPLDQAAAPASGPIGLQPPPERRPAEEEPMPDAGIPGLRPPPPQDEPPPPNYLSPGTASPGGGMGSGQVRVSLTGEVIEVPPSAPAAPAPGAYPPAGPGPRPGAPPPPAAGRGPMPPPARQGSYMMPPRRETAPAKSGSGAVVAIILVILLLAGGGGFGFWYWQKQRAPAVAAEKLLKAMQSKDWKTVYQMIELPAEQKAMVNEQNFTMAMGIVGNLFTIKDYKVGSATITGDTAKVQTTVTVELSPALAARAGGKTSQTKTDEAPMRLVNGEWKLDAAAAGGSGGLPGLGGPGGLR